MLRIALRQRTGLVLTSVICGLLALIYSASFAPAAGKTAAERAVFGHQMEALGHQLAYLFPIPRRVDTLGGYMLWRSYGLFVLVFAVWALLAAAGAARGEEDSGLLEQWLSAGAPRARLLLTRVAAFALYAGVAVVVTGLGAVLGTLGGPDRLEWNGLAGLSLVLLATTLAAYGITLLVAQQASNFRTAAGMGAVVVIGMAVLDGAFRTAGRQSWVQVLSIFNLYNRTDALIPGGGVDWPSFAALLAIAGAAAGLAAWAFGRRDLYRALVPGRPRQTRAVRVASRNPLLRPVLSSLWEQRLSLSLWAVGIFVFGLIETSAINSARSILESNPMLNQYLQGQGGGDPAVVFIGLAWFGLAGLVLAAYAIVQVAGWAAEDTSGRLEMVLSQPVRRWQVVVYRGLSLLISTAVLAAAGSLAVWLVARSSGLALPVDRLLIATVLLLPFTLTFAAIGAVLAGWRPRLATGVVAAVALISYTLQQVGPIFKWPDAVTNISLFKLYGTPLTQPVFMGGLYGMLAVIVVGFGIAILAMNRREVGR